MSAAKCLRIGLFVPTPYRDYNRVQSAIWIRALQMIEPLRAQGHQVYLNNPLLRYDVAIYHRGMMRKSLVFMHLLRRIAKRVYWDTCVDYFDEHEASSALQVRCSRAIAALADGVCVPSEGIAVGARRYSRNVFVMPDPIDLAHFAPARQGVNLDQPVIGWSGVAVKAGFLNQHAAFLDGRCRVICERPPKLDFAYDFVSWRHASFPEELRRCDLGFLPRALDTSYTVNNSSFKALVFAALGIPIIANALPSYRAMAQYYPAIAFLEDFGGDTADALIWLKTRNADPTQVRAAYDKALWARRLAHWVAA